MSRERLFSFELLYGKLFFWASKWKTIFNLNRNIAHATFYAYNGVFVITPIMEYLSYIYVVSVNLALNTVCLFGVETRAVMYKRPGWNIWRGKRLQTCRKDVHLHAWKDIVLYYHLTLRQNGSSSSIHVTYAKKRTTNAKNILYNIREETHNKSEESYIIAETPAKATNPFMGPTTIFWGLIYGHQKCSVTLR